MHERLHVLQVRFKTIFFVGFAFSGFPVLGFYFVVGLAAAGAASRGFSFLTGFAGFLAASYSVTGSSVLSAGQARLVDRSGQLGRRDWELGVYSL